MTTERELWDFMATYRATDDVKKIMEFLNKLEGIIRELQRQGKITS